MILTLLGAFPRGKRRGANYKYSVLKFMLDNRGDFGASILAEKTGVARTKIYEVMRFFEGLGVLKITPPKKFPSKYDHLGASARRTKKLELGYPVKVPGKTYSLDRAALIGAIDDTILKLGEEEDDRHALRVIELEKIREKAVDVIRLELI